MQTRNNPEKRLAASVAIIILLCCCLGITTFALVYSTVSVDNNLFTTGTVRINLNDGKQIIEETEFLFEPGITVKKDFFLQNESSCEVFYRLYFQNVKGGLADVLEVKICDGDKVLFAGTPRELEQQAVKAAEDVLRLNERRELQIYFHFPEAAGNDTQAMFLHFDLAADAVQTKNNPNKEFD